MKRYAQELALQGEPNRSLSTRDLMGGSLIEALAGLFATIEKVWAAIVAIEELAALPEVVRPRQTRAPRRDVTERVALAVERTAQVLLDDAMAFDKHPAWALLAAAAAVRTRGKLTPAEKAGARRKANRA